MTSKYIAIGEYGGISHPSKNISTVEILFMKKNLDVYNTILTKIEFFISSNKSSNDHKKLKMFIENMFNNKNSNIHYEYKNSSDDTINTVRISYDGTYLDYDYHGHHVDFSQKYRVNDSLLKAFKMIYKDLDSR